MGGESSNLCNPVLDDQPGFPIDGPRTGADAIFGATTGATRSKRPPYICRKPGDPRVIWDGPVSSHPSARGGTKAIALDPRKTATNRADLWQAERILWTVLQLNERDEFAIPDDWPRDRVIVRIQEDLDVDRLREGLLAWQESNELQKLSDRLSLLHARTYIRIKRQLADLTDPRMRSRLTATAYLLDALGEALYEKQGQAKVKSNPAVRYEERKFGLFRR